MCAYEPYLDGLFTYCLSVLCEHEAATAALGDVLAIAERQRGRCPGGAYCHRSWLYAVARWVCLRMLAEQHRAGDAFTPESPAGGPSSEAAARRHRELAALAWPEAAGTVPEQREALELAVRHGLPPEEVAVVLGREPGAVRGLLDDAGREVGRTRVALAAVESGACPVVARLTGDHQVLLGAALRRELVRHVEACPECRRAAERAGADRTPWRAAAAVPGTLPVLPAPRSAAYAAMGRATRRRGGRVRPGPRFDRNGFPVDLRGREARHRRIRSRAMTTVVVATVVAAPVIALWTAVRAQPTGERQIVGSAASAGEKTDRFAADVYEEAGNARTGPDPRFRGRMHGPDVSVEVIDLRDGKGHDSGRSPDARPWGSDRRAGDALGRRGPGRLGVEAQSNGDTTVITLTAWGGSPVRWSARVDAAWLRLSRTGGVLRPGESATFVVSVDTQHEPPGTWTARVVIGPSGTWVTVRGYGAKDEPARGDSSPSPGDQPPAPSDPTPSPQEPSPEPGDSSPSPPSSPDPGGSG